MTYWGNKGWQGNVVLVDGDGLGEGGLFKRDTMGRVTDLVKFGWVQIVTETALHHSANIQLYVINAR